MPVWPQPGPKAFSKSVDKRAFRWLSRPRSGRIETEKGGKLGFGRPFDCTQGMLNHRFTPGFATLKKP